MSTAILVDGGFFIKRYRAVYPSTQQSPEDVAKNLFTLSLSYLEHKGSSNQLYRIFYYDCPPLEKKLHHPISNKCIDYSRSNEALFRTSLHDALKQTRKVALRLGQLTEHCSWKFRDQKKFKSVIQGKIPIEELQEYDLVHDVIQKGVDMKIGLDIASLAYKRLVDQIILIAGDSDFVPAAKLARREGIDFILDPIYNTIRPDLHEHIDGIMTKCPKPAKKSSSLY